MKFTTAELIYSPSKEQEAIVLKGEESIDFDTKTYTCEKVFIWDDSPNFGKFKKGLGLWAPFSLLEC